MNIQTTLQLAIGTLLLFLVLMLSYLTTSLLFKFLSQRLSRGVLASWLADKESAVAVSVWAAVAIATYFLGPQLLLFLLNSAGH
jgi:hypothetical protein